MMDTTVCTDPPRPARSLRLVPRLEDQGYERSLVDRRRAWVEGETGARFEHLGAFTIPSEEMRGNVENPIGAVQMPLGLAGPLRVTSAPSVVASGT